MRSILFTSQEKRLNRLGLFLLSVCSLCSPQLQPSALRREDFALQVQRPARPWPVVHCRLRNRDPPEPRGANNLPVLLQLPQRRNAHSKRLLLLIPRYVVCVSLCSGSAPAQGGIVARKGAGGKGSIPCRLCLRVFSRDIIAYVRMAH